MRKRFTLLYSDSQKTISFPIKSQRNLFDGATQWAGGNPVMFGGTVEGQEAALRTIQRESWEESCRSLIPGNCYQFVVFGEYEFFYTDDWHFVPTDHVPQRREEGEMQLPIVPMPTVSLRAFSNQWTDAQIRTRLLHDSGAPGGNAEQNNQFVIADTTRAMIHFIRSNI